MTVRDISLDKRYLRVTSETFERLPLGELDPSAPQYGRNWAGPAVFGENFRRIVGYETFEHYNLGVGDVPYALGDGWDAAAVVGQNYARLLGEDDANGYSVGTGDAPYSSGIGLSTPTINGVDIVNISGSDNGFRVVSGGIAWQLDPSESWDSIQIGCLVHVPVTAATGLGADTLRIGVCHGAGGIPGIVADGSVGNAIFWRSVGWVYHAASGTIQAAAGGSQQMGKIVAGTQTTTSISTISRVGAISSAPAVVRCPVVITVTKGSPNYELAVARRTSTTVGPGYDRDEDVMRAATESIVPAGTMGAQHNQHSNSIAFSASDGTPDTFFLQCSNAAGAYFSGIYVARIA